MHRVAQILPRGSRQTWRGLGVSVPCRACEDSTQPGLRRRAAAQSCAGPGSLGFANRSGMGSAGGLYEHSSQLAGTFEVMLLLV